MTTTNSKRPVVDPGQCRCCASTKKCRLLNVEYEWIGQKEVYSEMFVETFGLVLSHLDGEPEERLICATCVSRLRDASAFRRQVLACEEQLLNTTIQIHGPEELSKAIKEENDLKAETDCLTNEAKNNQTFSQNAQNVGQNNGSAVQSDTIVGASHLDDQDMNQDDHFDDQDDDSDNEPLANVKSVETKLKRLKKQKKCKVKKKSKNIKSKKLSKQEKLRAKREMLAALAMMDDRLAEYDEIEEPKTRQKPRDTDQKALHNTVTIVENSFVCPFDTSFSDYFCIYCREGFTDCDKLKIHTLDHDPVGYKNAILNNNVNKKLLQIDITRLDCRLCNESIQDLDNLRKHLEAHGKVLHPIKNEFLSFKLTNNNLTCLECNNNFSFFHALKKHMAEHFGTCICDVCGAHYFEERMLILHQKTHQRVDENFPCESCDKLFKSKHSRYLHEARTHKKEPAYQCPKCDEIFFSYSIRYRHMIQVHNEQRMFKCNHCDRAYDSRKSLREHNRRFHLKIFKHECELCDKRFYIPSRLKEHMATHTGERNYRCECCGKSYPRLRGLKVHMQSHNGERRHRCSTCGAAFTQLANLKTHLRRQHGLPSESGY